MSAISTAERIGDIDTRVPEVGQIVTVRGANWAVADVQQQSLPRSAQDDAVAAPARRDAPVRRGRPARPRAPGRLGARAGAQPACRARPADRHRPEPSSTIPTGSPPSSTRSAGARSPAPTTRPSRRRSAAAPTSRPTSSSRSPAPCAAPAPTCCSPTTSVSARRSRPAWSSRSCSSVTARGRRSSSARPGSCLKWQDEMQEKFGLDFDDRQLRDDEGGPPRPTASTPTRSRCSRASSCRWPGCRASALSASSATRFADRTDRAASPSTSSSSTRPTTSPRAARRAPTRSGIERRGYAVDSQRTRAVRDLAERAEHRLFLSRHAAQRLHRVVHRAAGDDRPAALRPRQRRSTRRRCGRSRSAASSATCKRSRASPTARSRPLLLHAGRRRGRGVRPAARLHPAARQGGRHRRRRAAAPGTGHPAAEEALLLLAGRVRPHRRRLPRHPQPRPRRRLRRRTTTRSSAPMPTISRRASVDQPELQALEQAKRVAPAAHRRGQGRPRAG